MHIKLFEDENEVNLDEMFDEINSKHFNGRINKIPCIWNIRLRTCAGKCYYRSRVERESFGNGYHTFYTYTPTKIELSKKLFENNNMDIEKITRTLAHEMTHAYLAQVHNEVGHTDRFQQIMTRITGENINHRCHSYDVTGLRNKRSVHYICECGETEGYRTRMPKAGSRYTARCCKGSVTFSRVQVEEEVMSVASNAKDKNNDNFISLF